MQSVQAYTKERRQASLWRRMGRCWQLYLLLIPAVIYIFIFNYLPLYGIQIAFRNYSPRKGYWGSPWVGWKYFDRFFSSPDCWKLITTRSSRSATTCTATSWWKSIRPVTISLWLPNGRSRK